MDTDFRRGCRSSVFRIYLVSVRRVQQSGGGPRALQDAARVMMPAAFAHPCCCTLALAFQNGLRHCYLAAGKRALSCEFETKRECHCPNNNADRFVRPLYEY